VTDRARAVWLAALSLVVVSCLHSPPPAPVRPPAPVIVTSPYPGILADATRDAQHGRFAQADSALADFALHHAQSPESRDASFWRAMFALDPANRVTSLSFAAEQLDLYLADSAQATHRAEAAIMRRLVGTMQASAAALERARAAPTISPREQALAQENAALKEQLAKTTAELERIRKRLGGRP
jgi:hypothetical protein